MVFNKEGITTGLLGYSLRNEFFSDALPFRQVETFNFEIYSTDISGLSPQTIQSGIYTQFTGLYSGNIDVKAFVAPTEYLFPNDNIRTAKFNVQVDVRHAPYNISGYAELTGSYYAGANPSFWQQYAYLMLDFKEDFTFDKQENGNYLFSHNVGFGLISGGKAVAGQIISGLFTGDSSTPFGLSVFISGITGANTNLVQNYFTESMDLIRNSYSFSKKREFYPMDGGSYSYNLVHSMTLKEDGVFDITEKCDLQGKISFLQATQGLALVFNNSLGRCTDFYNSFNDNIAQPGEPNSIAPVSQTPRRYVQNFNIPSLSAGYEIVYTNDPEFSNGGYYTEEVIDFDMNDKNIVTISDKYTFTFNKRNPSFMGAYTLITGVYASSPAAMSGYYQSSAYFNSGWPLNLIDIDTTWPYNKHQSNINLTYSNDPRNNVTINGVNFKTLNYRVTNTQPVDIIQEYKIINRPNKLSVLNYAYQSEKGQISVNIEAGIGRLANEFVTGFRSDVATYISAIYPFAISLFWGQFNNILPISFTYYLSDIKYSLDNEGMLNFTTDFTYTVKRYLM